MTILRLDLGFEIMCDGPRCHEFLDFTDTNEWCAMMEMVRAEGWVTFKDKDGEWVNLCPACREDVGG